jgi:hypothetical protein
MEFTPGRFTLACQSSCDKHMGEQESLSIGPNSCGRTPGKEMEGVQVRVLSMVCGLKQVTGISEPVVWEEKSDSTSVSRELGCSSVAKH